MKFKYVLLAIAAAVTAVTACNEPEEDNGGEGGKTNPPTPVVINGEVNWADGIGSEVVVPAVGGTVNMVFKATKDWTAATEADWITIQPASGAAGESVTLTVTVAANEDYDYRSATVTITCDKATASANIVQKQKDGFVMTPETIQVPQEGKTLDIRVHTNVEVRGIPGADWIKLVGIYEVKGLQEVSFVYEVEPNETFESRVGEILFMTSVSNETITIEQAAAEKPEPPAPEDPFGGELETITATTTWAGSVFDAIIDAHASGQTEWQSPDGENFIDTKLGYLAGYTTSVNEETGEEQTTYGKFKFKKDEKAYNSGTKMSRVQFGGTGKPAQRTNLVFKVNGSGALTVIARSSGDAARNLAVEVNGVPVQEGGYEMPGKAEDAKTISIAVTANDGDLVYVYSMSSGINLYSMKWVPGGTPENPGDNPGDDPGDDPVPGENAELDCPNPPTVGTVPVDQLVGYGANVTGGEGGTILHFDNGKALQTWLLARTKSEKKGDHSPVIIWLSGTFKPDDGRDFSEAHPWFDVKDVSNLSFIGTDKFVMDRIGIFCVRANNIVIRNINFQQPKANNGADAVSMQECDGVWVDHCTFTSLNQTKDYEDGSTDITHGSKNVTVSWCKYVKTQKSCLVGHSNSQSGDAAITATFHHNWFQGSSSRHPRVRFGKVHVYNNFFDGNTTYGVGSAYGAKVLVEYNYFDGVQLPTDICTYPAKESGVSNLQGSVAGYLWATQDVFVNRPAKAKDPYPLTNIKYTSYNGSTIEPLTYADFKPSYDYTVTAAVDVPSVVREGAGFGVLGYTEAPVAVNNGGITEFDGTDDDPVNPDEDDPDDPDQPGTDGPGTYTLSMQNKSLVQTFNGTAGATYFDASTSVADFSKDYSGSFTIDGTTYSQGIKMDSKGYVNFTTSAENTTTVRFYAARRKADATTAKMQLVTASGEATVFDVTPHDTYMDTGEITLEKGTAYTIKQKSGEQAVILVIVKETE